MPAVPLSTWRANFQSGEEHGERDPESWLNYVKDAWAHDDGHNGGKVGTGTQANSPYVLSIPQAKPMGMDNVQGICPT